MSGALPGLDLGRLQAWLATARPGLASGELRGEVIAGGLSNLSYALTDGERRWVLRRPPLGHVLSTAHDMGREFRVVRALAGTDVPVPTAHLLHDDADGAAGVGTVFYLMDFVEGRTMRAAADNLALDRAAIGAIGPELVRVLARLHAVDPATVGLEDFGRPEGFLDRQVGRWRRQLDQSRSRELPGLDALFDAVASQVPTTMRSAIVHGDYRLDNTLIRIRDGRPAIAAVLDWEMSTLGDVLTDLGLLGVYWRLHEIPAAQDSPLASAIDPAAGYASFEALLDDYAAERSMAMPDIAWYSAFAAYKLAVILEGIHYRHRQGQTVGEGFDRVGAIVPGLAEQGLAQLR